MNLHRDICKNVALDPNTLHRPFIDILADIAEMAPLRLAICDERTRLTYRDLVKLITHLASAITAQATPPGPIAVMLDDTVFYVAAMLAVIQAGHPVLLLDPAHPPAQTQRMIAAAGLSAIIVEDADWGAVGLPTPLLPVPLLPLPLPLLLAAKPGGASVAMPFEEAALLMSTSGSTGVPKITAHSQQSLLRRFGDNVFPPSVAPGEPCLILGAPRTWAAVRSRLVVLLCGGLLILANLQRFGLASLLQRLRQERCRMLRATPSMMKAIARLDEAPRALASLRLLRLGGERLLHAELRAIRSVLPPECRINYTLGSTETSVAAWIIPEHDDHDPVHVACGRPRPNVTVKILDERGRDVPQGQSGELAITLEMAALGDWVAGRIDRTRFEHMDGTKLFHTGDLARICPDGVLVVEGRKDRMVKVLGQRVEPGAIEAVLQTLPWVQDAAVIPRPTPDGIVLCGFVVPGPHAPAQPLPALRRHLRREMPSHMRPGQLHLVDAIAINASDKRDEQGLIAIADAAMAMHATHSSADLGPDADIDPQALSAISNAWRRVLPACPQPQEACFDEAGGDSLRFVEMLLHLERQLARSVPMECLALDMTRTDMARALTQYLRSESCPAGASGPSGDQVFMLPGAGGAEPGTAWLRVACAPALAVTQLHYGNWIEFQRPDFDFTTLFNRLLSQILAEAPTGPIRIIGYSMGGKLAWLLAARLEQMGHELAGLVMLDTPSPRSTVDVHGVVDRAHPSLTWKTEWRQLQQAHQVGRLRVMLARIAARRLLAPRGQKLLHLLARHHRWMPMLMGAYLGNDLTSSLLGRQVRSWMSELDTLPTLRAPTLLVRARENRHPDWDMGWQEFCQQIDVKSVEGDHLTMLAADRTQDVASHITAAFMRWARQPGRPPALPPGRLADRTSP